MMLYYDTYDELRPLCHHIKDGKAYRESMQLVASDIRQLVRERDAVIVPVPSHIGYATYTKEIAEMTGLPVVDCIRCFPHEALYDMKKRGETVKPGHLQFYLDLTVKIPDRPIYIFDLVYATGTTAKAAQRLFNRETTMLVFAFDEKASRMYNTKS